MHFSWQTGREQESERAQCPFFYNMVYIQYSMSVCWKRERDIISTFTREQPSIHLKAPGGQSPAQTHAAALLCAHANTRAHKHTEQLGTHFCATDFDVTNAEHIFPLAHTLAWGFILYTEISELIASSSWAYPHTYTEIMVLDALMLSSHEYA